MGISGAGTQAEQHAAGHRGGHQKAAICNHDILLAWGGPGMVRSLGPLSGPVHGVMGWCKEAPDHVPIQKGKSPRDRQFQAPFPIVMTLTILFRYSKNTSCNCHFIYFKNGNIPRLLTLPPSPNTRENTEHMSEVFSSLPPSPTRRSGP
jgi:hypothetical protein